MKLGLRGKLFLLSLLVAAMALAAAYALLAPRLERGEIERAEQEGRRLAAAASEALAAAPAADLHELAQGLTRATGVRVSFIARDGRVLGDGEVERVDLPRVENHAARPEVRAALAGRVGSATRLSQTVGVRFLYVAVAPGDPAGPIARVAVPLTRMERTRAGLGRSLLVAALAALLVAAALSSIASGLVARPLGDMTAVARGLAARDFSLRARAGGGGEIAALGRALNQLSADLERTLAELTRERDLLQAILDGMTEGVLLTDPRGRILRANASLHRLLDLPASAAPDASTPPTLLEATRSPTLDRHLARALSAGTPATAEIELPGPPRRDLHLSSAPLGGGAGVVTVFHDVTELKRLERVRRDFVANVSHELRTPVAALQAAGETLLGGALAEPEQARQFVAIIARNAERLGNLVSDLLALARIESGELDLRLEAIPARAVCQEQIAALGGAFATRRLSVSNLVPEGLCVRADGRALGQALRNLLENASRYTPEGGAVGIEAHDRDGRVRLEVWDTGPGIEPHQRERVFERFYRVDPGRSRAVGGTGLGLSIVRHLVEAMGGACGVEGREGGGSRFWILLPPV